MDTATFPQDNQDPTQALVPHTVQRTLTDMDSVDHGRTHRNTLAQQFVSGCDVSEYLASCAETITPRPANVNPLDLSTLSANDPTCGTVTQEVWRSVSHGIRPDTPKCVRNTGDQPPPGPCPYCLKLPVDRFRWRKVNF